MTLPSTSSGAWITNVIVAYSYIATGAQTRGRERDTDLVETIKAPVKAEWYRTIHNLRRMVLQDPASALKCEPLIQDWISLGQALLFDEAVEKKEYEKEMRRVAQLCARRECEFHEKPPPRATRTCAGCHEVVSTCFSI